LHVYTTVGSEEKGNITIGSAPTASSLQDQTSPSNSPPPDRLILDMIGATIYKKIPHPRRRRIVYINSVAEQPHDHLTR